MTGGAEPSPTPASTGLRPHFREITGFAGSQYLTRFATILKGFIVAKLLGPEGNGMWQHFVLVSDYALYSQLGALPGLNKELGHRRGGMDDAAVAAAQNTGLGAVLLSAIGMAAALVAYVLWRGDALHPVDRLGLPILGLIVIAEQLNFTFMAILRVHGQIRPITRAANAFAILNLVVSVALLPAFGVVGLLLGWLATRAATTALLIRAGGHDVRPALDAAILRRLLAVGFPIFLFHLTRVALRNIDRVLVDRVLDASQLGIYGLAVTIAGLSLYVAEAIAFVLYPIYLKTYGETRDPTRLGDQLTKPTEFLAMTLPVALGLSCLVLHVPILWLLPEFAACIDVFRVLCVAVGLSCLATLPGFFLMAIDRQNVLVPLGILVVAFDYFAGRWAISTGAGLTGVAAAMGVGTFVHATFVLGIAGRHALGDAGRTLRWVLRSYAPGAAAAGLVCALLHFVPRTPLAAAGETARAGVMGAVFLALTLPVLFHYERRTGFLRSFRRSSAR